ncbi:hypothetical protein TNCV_991311 [Trichonephila clavipes]|nr:hypothetical protein TNCV_991311 [Trichonephila clavipes]
MTVIDLKNMIIGSKDYEEEFVKAYLSVISEERFERETEEKITRQHAIEQLRLESELHKGSQRCYIFLERNLTPLRPHKLRLAIESIQSNVRRTSCAEDLKKTSSNYQISIGREGRGTCEGSSPAVLMAEATIPVTTPIKEEKGMDDLRVVHVKVKGEQERVNAVIDTGAQMPVVRADVVEGQSIDSRGSIQITSAFGEHEMGELKGSNMEMNDPRNGVVPISKNFVYGMLICSSDYEGLIENSQFIRNPAILREPSKKEGIINSTDSKSVCSQEVVIDLRPETYTQSLSNAPNENSVVVESNAWNVQTNGQDDGDKHVNNQFQTFGISASLPNIAITLKRRGNITDFVIIRKTLSFVDDVRVVSNMGTTPICDVDSLVKIMCILPKVNLAKSIVNPPNGQHGIFHPTREASKTDQTEFFSHSLSSLLNYLRAFGDGPVAGEQGGQGIQSWLACLEFEPSATKKTHRVGQRCMLNLSRAEMSCRWCGVVVRRGVPAQVSPSSFDHFSKLRGPSLKALV